MVSQAAIPEVINLGFGIPEGVIPAFAELLEVPENGSLDERRATFAVVAAALEEAEKHNQPTAALLVALIAKMEYGEKLALLATLDALAQLQLPEKCRPLVLTGVAHFPTTGGRRSKSTSGTL